MVLNRNAYKLRFMFQMIFIYMAFAVCVNYTPLFAQKRKYSSKWHIIEGKNTTI